MKIKSLALTLGIAVGGSIVSGVFAPAQAVSFLNTLGIDSPSTIGSIDSGTGIFNPVITNGPNLLTDIALSGSGQLFGTTFSNELYTFNPATNSSTLVGGLGTFINGLGFAADGNLYGTGGNADTGGNGFYQINTANGAARQVGANIANFRSGGDIVFNPITNRFLAASSSPNDSTLFSIGLDGSATEIGNIGFNNVFGLFFEGGQLFGATRDRQQIKINLLNGAGIPDLNITGTTASIGGAASSISTVPVAAVPEPFTIIGTLIGGTAALRMRNKLKDSNKA